MYLSFDRELHEFEGVNDGETIMAMLEEATLEEVVAYRDWLYPTSTFSWKRGGEYRQFMCRHFDHETRRCAIHETKPEVCRDYPYDDACDYCGFMETPDVVAKWVAIRAEQDGVRAVA